VTMKTFCDQLCVVACASMKRETPSPARELYLSPLFRKAYALAEQIAPVFIASAEHGLVEPERELAPYDTMLSDLSIVEQRAWGVRVATALHAVFDTRELVRRGFVNRIVHLFAGAVYARPIRSGLEQIARVHRVAYVLEEPLAGLSIGKRLAYLNGALATRLEDVP